MRKVLIEIVEEASKELAALKNDFEVKEKGSSRNLVTSCDVALQEFIIQKCNAVAPQAKVLAEESGLDSADLEDGEFFVVDPIDGIANFANGFPHYCISLAYGNEGSVLAGAVFDPSTNEMFSAERGGGSFLNESPLWVEEKDLRKTLVCFGTSPYCDGKSEATFELVKLLFERCSDVRRSGSAALDICSVAAGRFGIFYELEIQPWDYAAAAVIASEAGALVCDFKEKPLELNGSTTCFAGTKKDFAVFSELYESCFNG